MTTLMKKTMLATPIAAIATFGFASAAFAAAPHAHAPKAAIQINANILTTGTHLKANNKVAKFAYKVTPRKTIIVKKRGLISYTPIYKAKPSIYGKTYSYGYKPVYTPKLKTLKRAKALKFKKAY